MQVTKLPTTFFVFLRVPLTHLGRWFAFTIKIPWDYICPLTKTSTEMLHLNTFGEQSFRKQKCDVTTLLLEDRNNETAKISVLRFPVICSSLPSQVDVTTYPHLHGLQLAACSDSNDPIDVLIGSDYYWDLVTTEIVRGDFGPTAINSRFGWMLSGPTKSVMKSHTTTTNLIISGTSDGVLDHSHDPPVTTLRQFWETESIRITGDPEPKKAIDCFNENVRFNRERYEVELPWKENHPAISSDYELCINRLKSIQRKMLKEPELIREYNQTIEDQLSKGIVERVPAIRLKKRPGDN